MATSATWPVLFSCWLTRGLVVRPRLDDPFVSQNHKDFLRLIFLDGFWVVHRLPVHMVEFKFLAQFPVDHLAHPVMYYYCCCCCYSWRVFDTGVWVTSSPQVSRTLLIILTDLNNAVVWMVSTCRLISKPSSTYMKPSGIVPSVSITIGIRVTFMFQSII